MKEKYADLRKKAKTMNFSIAYGKTAHGFQKDWDCTLEEAQESLRAWYSDRKEVVEWQIRVQALALQKGISFLFNSRLDINPDGSLSATGAILPSRGQQRLDLIWTSSGYQHTYLRRSRRYCDCLYGQNR